ncbi:MAG: hypothetical protein EA400_11150 [Chromatiaceae bacterium]|nr:MAG: hypothetical protein EA400_11150 [Chromatiaceae bacterium]
MSHSHRRLACWLAAALLILAGPALGQRDGRGGGMTADQAAEQVRQQTGGRVLRVDRTGSGYRVKVLTPAGEVREIEVAAERR